MENAKTSTALKTRLKKNKVEGPALSVTRTYCKAIVKKTTAQCRANRPRDQNRAQNNHSYTDAWFTAKVVLQSSVFSNCAETIEYPYGKK